MSTDAVSSTSASDIFNSVRYQNATREVSKTLDQDDFLKLLTTQLENQDPMDPMDDTDFIAQMANFTSLEQTKAMSSTMEKLLATQQSLGLTSYLGKQVTLAPDESTTVTGIVEEVRSHDDSLYLVINGEEYEATNITRVAEAPKTETTNPTE